MTEEPKRRGRPPKQENQNVSVRDDETQKMNALALRIWQGQSISLPIKVRVKRIADALREKGFNDLSGLALPTTENIKRFL